jgi:hypothetical protein
MPDDIKQSDETKLDLATAASDPNWHVWEVSGHFIAATSLESAIDFFAGDWGVERDEVIYDDTHCDRSDYYTNLGEDEHPSSIMRVVAEGLIADGKEMPFDFARTE